MNWTSFIIQFGIQCLISIVVFVVLIYVGGFIFDKIKSNSHIKNSKLLNLAEYLPEEEYTTIKQVFYLVMIVIFVVSILYILFGWIDDYTNLFVLDTLLSLYIVINGDITFSKNKFIFFLIVPFGSLSALIFANDIATAMYFLHVLAFLYLIRVYFKKFQDYTETNSLGITILLLFAIVFISFFITIVVEGVSPLDSLVMVSNAFTSNGYSVLGHSTAGKVNALLLVWSGFILSGVGTATLAVAIIMRYADKRFDRLEEKVKKNKKN